jgi:hypothetical protein
MYFQSEPLISGPVTSLHGDRGTTELLVWAVKVRARNPNMVEIGHVEETRKLTSLDPDADSLKVVTAKIYAKSSVRQIRSTSKYPAQDCHLHKEILLHPVLVTSVRP